MGKRAASASASSKKSDSLSLEYGQLSGKYKRLKAKMKVYSDEATSKNTALRAGTLSSSVHRTQELVVSLY